MGVNAVLELVVHGEHHELERTRELVVAHLRRQRPGAGARMVYATELVLEEWLTNVFAHGRGTRVELKATAIPDGDFELRFEDDGIAFDPSAQPQPERARSLDELQPGGFGLVLIRRFSRSWRYAREQGRNVMVMRITDDDRRS